MVESKYNDFSPVSKKYLNESFAKAKANTSHRHVYNTFLSLYDSFGCKIENKTIAEYAGLNQGTISDPMRWLIDAGYILEIQDTSRKREILPAIPTCTSFIGKVLSITDHVTTFLQRIPYTDIDVAVTIPTDHIPIQVLYSFKEGVEYHVIYQFLAVREVIDKYLDITAINIKEYNSLESLNYYIDNTFIPRKIIKSQINLTLMKQIND